MQCNVYDQERSGKVCILLVNVCLRIKSVSGVEWGSVGSTYADCIYKENRIQEDLCVITIRQYNTRTILLKFTVYDIGRARG